MHTHRTARTRFFTTLGNEVLRDNRLSFCARGILGHLLSLPDGQRSDIRTLTERTPEGRERVASALRELERFGYLRRAVKRTPDGRLHTEVDVYDNPSGAHTQTGPQAGIPGPGGPARQPGGDHPVNERDEEPSLPAPPATDGADGTDEQAGRAGDEHGDDEHAASAALLTRVTRAEPRLALGRREIDDLANLVTQWRRRGASDLHIINTLTAGLPSRIHHPARLVECRLRDKIPPVPVTPPARPECDTCRAPIATAGRCRACRQPATNAPRTSADFLQRLTRGAALARSALRNAQAGGALPLAA